MHMLTDSAVRLRTYDAFADARRLGITVGFLPISTSDLVWLPEENAIVIDSKVVDPIERHCLLGHAVAHATVEGTGLMRRWRAGRASSGQVERRVRRIASRRLVHTEALVEVLGVTGDAREAAGLLGVTLVTLADRMRDLNLRDQRAFGGVVPVLLWPVLMEGVFPHACGVGGARGDAVSGVRSVGVAVASVLGVSVV